MTGNDGSGLTRSGFGRASPVLMLLLRLGRADSSTMAGANTTLSSADMSRELISEMGCKVEDDAVGRPDLAGPVVKTLSEETWRTTRD